MRDILDRQANNIEYVLHMHGIQARIDGGKLSPRLAHFHIVLPPGVRPAQLAAIAPEIADNLGVLSCRLAPAEDGAYLEAPRPDPVPVRLLSIVQRVADVVPPITATLGLDTDGTPLLLRLNSPDVDPVLVGGDEGAGKSSLLRGMALSLALHNSPGNLRLLLLDCASGGAFAGMEGLPHMACPVANGPIESLASLRWASRVMARHAPASSEEELFFDEEPADEALDNLTNPAAHEPALVILIDGADALLTANRQASIEAQEILNRLLSAGSQYDIHIVMSAERPDRLAGFAGMWGARIVGKVSSPEMARLASGVKGSGAHGLLGEGDFLISLNAELIRFQAGRLSSAESARAVDLICECALARFEPERAEPNLQEGNRDSGPLPFQRLWTGN